MSINPIPVIKSESTLSHTSNVAFNKHRDFKTVDSDVVELFSFNSADYNFWEDDFSTRLVPKNQLNAQRLKELGIKTINDVFNTHIKIKLDREFLLSFLTYVNTFVRKDENHIAFFGGNLIGVYPIKWTVDDKMVLIDEVFKIDDYDQLCHDIFDLPEINKNFQVSSDAINLSFLWLAHQALVSKNLNEKDKMHLATASINMLQYKFISSIHTHYFKYSANMSIAMAVYENLDNKSQLKRLGSWQALVDSRTADILGTDSLHTKTIRTLEDDIEVVKMVNDIWNRIKSIFNILTRDFYAIKDSNARIASSSKFTTIDGENILKDSVNKYSTIKSIMHDVVPDKNAFIKADLVSAVININNSAYPTYFNNSLLFISENYLAREKHFNIPVLIEETLSFMFDLLRKREIALDNIPEIAIKLRGALRASGLVSSEYNKIKEEVDYIVETANPRISDTNTATTRICVVMYISLRALLKN